MQNFDFYTGKQMKNAPPQFGVQDPEYFTRLAATDSRDQERSRKKATRMISFVIALCIISFTTGLVVGIKFAAAPGKDIVDARTRKAVSNIGEKVTGLMKDTTPRAANAEVKKNLFPKDDFPYVIKIGRDYDAPRSQEISAFLSGHGHTVILSKNEKHYRIYTGPYKNLKDAEISLKKITAYNSKGLFSQAAILKR